MWRTSARVSRSVIAATPQSASHVSQPCSAPGASSRSTAARMIAARDRDFKKPLKWFSIGQFFRYEKQQRGRLREHYQLNCDIIGESDPSADAELIALLIDTLRAFGLTEQDFVIRLSSRNAWQEFYKSGKDGVSPSQIKK